MNEPKTGKRFGWGAIAVTALVTAVSLGIVVLLIWPKNNNAPPPGMATNEFLISSNGLFVVRVRSEFTGNYNVRLSFIKDGQHTVIKNYGKAWSPMKKTITEVKIGCVLEKGTDHHILRLHSIENKRRGGYGINIFEPEPIDLDGLQYGRLRIIEKNLADDPIPLTQNPMPILYIQTSDNGGRYVIELVRDTDTDE